MTDRIDARPTSPQAGPLSAAAADRLDSLFRLYSRQVLAHAARRARRPADVEDIAAEAWARACRYIHRLRADDDHAMPWLATAVRSAAWNFYLPKRAAELPQDFADDLAARELPAALPADTDLYAFAELTAPQAVAFKLAAQGLTNTRIAARLGKSRQAVQQNLKGAARRLRAVNEPLPQRPTPHERDGRQPSPAPTRPRSTAGQLAGVAA